MKLCFNNGLAILSLIGVCLLFTWCNKNDIVKPDSPAVSGDVQVIAPYQVRSGDYVPIVVRMFADHQALNTTFTQKTHLSSDNALLEQQLISIKKGVGSLTTQIESRQRFRISASGPGKATGTKTIIVSDSIAVIEHSGTLSAQQVVWDDASEHLISGDFTIPQGSELIIQAGTRIKLDRRVNFFVHGSIRVEGIPARPVVFISNSWAFPWGGIEVIGGRGVFQHCFFVNGGADDSRMFGHSLSQPVVMARELAEIGLDFCYLLDNVGKGLGSDRGVITVTNCLISRCDTGGEFKYAQTSIADTYILDIPNDDGVFVDDDNDGFYFHRQFPGWNGSSKVERCVFITGKDDAIDHNGAKLVIRDSWLEGFMHEGLAGSHGDTVRISNTVIKKCEQGIEAGWGSPTVLVDHCVVVGNQIGLRFGDSYATGCFGRMIVANTILFGNKDNVWNFDLLTQAPVDSGILLSYSMTNDSEYDLSPYCITGAPRFDENYYLLPGSAGKGGGENGQDMGLVRK